MRSPGIHGVRPSSSSAEPPARGPAPGRVPPIRGRGAARNPFTLDRVRPGALAWDHADDPAAAPAAVLAALDAAPWGEAAIVGPHGTGKSSLLVAVERHLERAGRPVGRVTAPGRDERNRRAPRAARAAAVRAAVDATVRLTAGGGDGGDGGERPVLLLDSADRLGRWERATVRRAARRRGVRLLMVTHAPLAGVPTALDRVVAPTLARRIARGLAAGTDFPVPDEPWFAAALAAEHGSFRAVLERLYDAYEVHHRRGRGRDAGGPSRE